MNPDDLGTGLAGFGLIVIGAYNAWQSLQAKREARDAARSSKAAASTLTTNNGGSHVKDSLDRIERRQEDDGALLRDHLQVSARTESHIFERLERLERRPRLPFL